MDIPSVPSFVTLLLVRHGQPTADHEGLHGDDPELTDDGRRQAAAVAETLEASRIEALYTSPSRRAVQTADAIASRLRLRSVLDARLAEIELSGDVIRQMVASGVFPLWQAHHRSRESAESLADFGARVAAFFSDAAERHEGHTVAVVTHGGVINQLLRLALGFPADHQWQFHFQLLNGSMTEVVFWPRGAATDHAPWYSAIKRVGDTAHLAVSASHV